MGLSDYKVEAAVAVSDLERARDFYERALGLKPIEQEEQGSRYPCGGGTGIFVYLSPDNAGNATATVAGWFVNDLEAVMAKRGVTLDGCVNFELKIDVIVPRMAGRRSCPKDGSVYHVTGNPPKVAGKCDRCGGDLVQRADDKEEVVRERMKTYAQKTEPLINHYQQKGLIINVDADGGVEQVYKRLCEALQGRAKVGAK